jgi:hypothetical protein
MRLLIFMLFASLRVAHADPNTIAVSVERAELATLWRSTVETTEEPIGLRIDKPGPVLAKLKLAKGDIIRAVNGRVASHPDPLGLRDSAVVYIEVLRSKQLFVVRVALKPPAVSDEKLERSWIVDHLAQMRSGVLMLAPVTRDGKPSGVAVTSSWVVFDDGDILRSVDGTAVTTIDQVAGAFDKAKDKPSIIVKLDRLDQPMTIKVTIEKGMTDELQAKLDAGIKKLDDTHYEIAKTVFDEVVANPMAIAKGARMVPAMKDGKPEGIKLYAIRPSSVYAKLGLTNGDTLVAINGFPLVSVDKALEVYTKIREAKLIVLDVVRRGKPLTLAYAIH